MKNDSPKIPIITLVLVAANLAVAFWAPFSIVSSQYAFQPLYPTAFSALTCLFMHDPQNLLHLLGNMVFLAAVGPLVESSVGRPKFVTIYILGGLAGVGGHWLVANVSGVGVPLIGASGAIAACVGYCSVRFMRRTVPLAPKFRISVGVVAVVWVFLQAIGTFVNFGDGGGSSFIAHLAGFTGGFLLAFVFRASKEAKIEHGHKLIDEMGERSPAALLGVAEDHLRDHPEDTKALWQKADALHAMGDFEHEADLLKQMLATGKERDLIIERLYKSNQIESLTPFERMKNATELNIELRTILLQSVIAEPDEEPERPHALLALAEVTDGEEREKFVAELKLKYELHAAMDIAKAKGLVR